MPLYEYQCDACGHRFETIVKFSDPPATACPACGGAVQKLVSSPAIQFKGSGWYITDYAKKSPTDSGGAKPAASASGDSKPADSSSGTSSSGAAAPAATASTTSKE